MDNLPNITKFIQLAHGIYATTGQTNWAQAADYANVELIGKGTYGCAIVDPEDTRQVVKIGYKHPVNDVSVGSFEYNQYDPYLAYAIFCFWYYKQCGYAQNTPLPKIFSIQIVGPFYIIRMERLSIMHDRFSTCRNHPWLEHAWENCVFISSRKYEKMPAEIRYVERFMDKPFNDTHCGNVMLRNGYPVMTDPYCGDGKMYTQWHIGWIKTRFHSINLHFINIDMFMRDNHDELRTLVVSYGEVPPVFVEKKDTVLWDIAVNAYFPQGGRVFSPLLQEP